MNGLDTLISQAFSMASHGLRLAIDAGLYAAPLAGIVLLANLICRKWLTAAQMSLLWALVLVRLLMPLAPSSILSLQNLFVADSTVAAAKDSTAWSLAAADVSPNLYHPGPAQAPVVVSETSRQDFWASLAGSLLPFVWFFGGALILARTLVVHWLFSRRVNRAPIFQDRRLIDLWKSSCDEAGVRRRIAIVQFDELAQPAVMGLFRLKLLLPTRVADLRHDQLRMIMLHELAHVRRYDIVLNWMLVAIRAVHWWNPVYWLAAGRFCVLREQACDAFVIRRMEGQPSRAYSELLLELAGRERAGFPWRVTLPASILGFLPAFFRKRAIRDRLRALGSAGLTPSRRHTAAVVALIALAAVCGLTDAKPPAASTDAHAPILGVNVDADVPLLGVNVDSLPAGDDAETDEEPIVTHTYDIEAVLARIEADLAATPDSVEALKFQIANVLRAEPGRRTMSRPSMYKLDGARLIVAAPARLHDELIENIKAWEQSGLGQIAVRCRFVISDHDIAPRAEFSWQYLDASASDSPKSLPSQRPTDRPLVRAQASAGLPVAFATLDKDQAAAVLQAVSTDRRTSILQAPVVTMFNGQQASIIDVTQQPYIVGIRTNLAGAREPNIRVYENGTKITLRPVHTSDRRKVHLQGRIELSQLGEGYVAPAGFGPEASSLQFPRSKQCRIDFACQVENGQSVLIGCLPADDEKRFFYALLTVRTVPDATDAAD